MEKEPILKKQRIPITLKKKTTRAVDTIEFQEKIQEVKEEQYPIFNEFLLINIFKYMDIKELLTFSQLCWKLRIFVRDKINRIWHFYYLQYTDTLPVKEWRHCERKYEYFVKSNGRRSARHISGNLVPLTLGCLDNKLLTKGGYPTQYQSYWNTQNNNGGNLPTYAEWTQIMAIPISESRLANEKIIPDDPVPSNTYSLNNVSYNCRYRHLWKKIYYPIGDPIYNKTYDHQKNYYWEISDRLSKDCLNTRNSGRTLEATNRDLQTRIEELKAAKKANDRMIRLQNMALEKAQILATPQLRPRFHMFRDLYLSKHGKYLSPSEASKLWAELSEDEKNRYKELAQIRYDDHLRRQEIYKKRF